MRSHLYPHNKRMLGEESSALLRLTLLPLSCLPHSLKPSGSLSDTTRPLALSTDIIRPLAHSPSGFPALWPSALWLSCPLAPVPSGLSALWLRLSDTNCPLALSALWLFRPLAPLLPVRFDLQVRRLSRSVSSSRLSPPLRLPFRLSFRIPPYLSSFSLRISRRSLSVRVIPFSL